MARGGMIKGLASQRPYDAGIIEAMLAGYALIGKKAPIYVALPVAPVTKDNLLDMWKEIYHAEASDNIKNSMN